MQGAAYSLVFAIDRQNLRSLTTTNLSVCDKYDCDDNDDNYDDDDDDDDDEFAARGSLLPGLRHRHTDPQVMMMMMMMNLVQGAAYSLMFPIDRQTDRQTLKSLTLTNIKAK